MEGWYTVQYAPHCLALAKGQRRALPPAGGRGGRGRGGGGGGSGVGLQLLIDGANVAYAFGEATAREL